MVVFSGVWRTAFSSRFRIIRWSSSGLPSIGSGPSSWPSMPPSPAGRPPPSRSPPLARERLGLLEGSGCDLAEVHVGARALAAGVRAGEQQEVGDESRHPPGRGESRVDRVAIVRRALAVHLEELEVRLDARQRGAELMRGVRDELTLAIERLLALG